MNNKMQSWEERFDKEWLSYFDNNCDDGKLIFKKYFSQEIQKAKQEAITKTIDYMSLDSKVAVKEEQKRILGLVGENERESIWNTGADETRNAYKNELRQQITGGEK